MKRICLLLPLLLLVYLQNPAMASASSEPDFEVLSSLTMTDTNKMYDCINENKGVYESYCVVRTRLSGIMLCMMDSPDFTTFKGSETTLYFHWKNGGSWSYFLMDSVSGDWAVSESGQGKSAYCSLNSSYLAEHVLYSNFDFYDSHGNCLISNFPIRISESIKGSDSIIPKQLSAIAETLVPFGLVIFSVVMIPVMIRQLKYYT